MDMIDINKLESTNLKYLENIKRITLSNKDVVKRYKMEQAEMMKQLMMSDDASVNMENFFKNFQVELARKENEEKAKIRDLISRELGMMQSEILALLEGTNTGINPSMPRVTPTPTTNVQAIQGEIPTYNAPTPPPVSQPSFQKPVEPTTNQQVRVSTQQTGANNQSNANDVENILKNINSTPAPQNTPPVQPSVASTPASNPVDSELSKTIDNISVNNEVPVETTELDEWISEIKNLI
ncbi:MAG: hypothetical protein ACK5HR_07170 [Mycoplasmatales bacterium]